MKFRFLFPVALPFVLHVGNGHADTRRVALSPPGTSVVLRMYGMGLLPLDGRFTRFDGVLTYDDGQQGVCRVELRIDVASLTMSNERIRDDVVGPDFMDAAQFPTLRYQGTCAGPELVGELAMHGVTRPFTLALTPEGTAVEAQGRLRRAEWGMTRRPLAGGSTARITVQVALPTAWGAG